MRTRETLFSILREREVHMNTLEESFIVRSTILCSIPEEVLEVGESPECLLQKFWTIREKQAMTMSAIKPPPFFCMCVCVFYNNKKKKILINSVVSYPCELYRKEKKKREIPFS